MPRAAKGIGRALAIAELIAGLVAGLWGTADAVRQIYLDLSLPSCVMQGKACVRDLQGSITFDVLVLMLSLLVGASAYVHVRTQRAIGLVGLCLLGGLFYLGAVLSWGAALVVPLVLTLVAILAGAFRLPFVRRVLATRTN